MTNSNDSLYSPPQPEPQQQPQLDWGTSAKPIECGSTSTGSPYGSLSERDCYQQIHDKCMREHGYAPTPLPTNLNSV